MKFIPFKTLTSSKILPSIGVRKYWKIFYPTKHILKPFQSGSLLKCHCSCFEISYGLDSNLPKREIYVGNEKGTPVDIAKSGI